MAKPRIMVLYYSMFGNTFKMAKAISAGIEASGCDAILRTVPELVPDKVIQANPAMKKAKALHVSFNKADPIILVGDERGGVNSFKLSKSLTKGPLVPVTEEEQGKTSQQLEEKKMEDFLNSQDKIIY